MGAAGDDLLMGFIRGHPHITLYLQESTSGARSRGDNHPKVFYTFLWELL
jgi:hypothetical protein